MDVKRKCPGCHQEVEVAERNGYILIHHAARSYQICWGSGTTHPDWKAPPCASD